TADQMSRNQALLSSMLSEAAERSPNCVRGKHGRAPGAVNARRGGLRVGSEKAPAAGARLRQSETRGPGASRVTDGAASKLMPPGFSSQRIGGAFLLLFFALFLFVLVARTDVFVALGAIETRCAHA